MFGPVRTYSDAFGYERMRLEASGRVRKHSNLLAIVCEFDEVFQFSEVFEAAGSYFDLCVPARMHSDAVGYVGKRSDGRLRAIYQRSPWR